MVSCAGDDGTEGLSAISEVLSLLATLDWPSPTCRCDALRILGFSRARSSGLLSVEKKEAEPSGVLM
jgi:hypothetical protein